MLSAVVNDIVLPYAVPALLVAYALTKYVLWGASPLIRLLNSPVPLPSEVIVSAMVGVISVLQQMPRAVTAAPPSEVMLPPQRAEFNVILLTS